MTELFRKALNLVADKNRSDFNAERIAEHSCPAQKFKADIFEFAAVLLGEHPYFTFSVD
jgi:hypothetical protein